MALVWQMFRLLVNLPNFSSCFSKFIKRGGEPAASVNIWYGPHQNFRLTNIKKKENITFSSNIMGFNLLHSDSVTNAGGVGAYIHDTISYRLRTDMPNSLHSSESFWIEVTAYKKQYIFGVIYNTGCVMRYCMVIHFLCSCEWRYSCGEDNVLCSPVKDWVAMLYFQLKRYKLQNRFRWLRWWIWRSTW